MPQWRSGKKLGMGKRERKGTERDQLTPEKRERIKVRNRRRRLKRKAAALRRQPFRC